jgi:RNA polymerase sigma factor (sigma-70 family)
MSTVEDAQLLNGYVAERSQEAFTELVRRHVDLVYATALRRVGGDSHLAEDIAQSVFADCARKAASLRTRPSLAGWLYRSTRFAAAQAVRTEQRRRNHEQEAYTVNELNAAGATHWERLRPVIDDALDDLNEEEREAVLLRYFENRPLAEVGAKFSISPDAARMRVERALEKLRGRLARHGVDSTAAALIAAFASQSGVAAPAGLSAAIVAGIFAQAGSAAVVTAGAWKIATLGAGKILAGCAVGALGIGVVVYVATPPRLEPEPPTSSAPSATAERSLPPPPAQVESTPPALAFDGNAAKAKRGPIDIDAAVERLDKLVHLTAAQKTQAADVFTNENDALQAIASPEDRLVEGMPIRQNARAQIRALLTPEQQQIYDAAPQRLGGGSMQDTAAVAARIDKVVALTDDQVAPVAAIYQQEADALRALSVDDRASGQGIAIRKAAQAQVRALLTLEQQQKFDANPNGAEDLAERAFVGSFLKTSPAIAARLGTITRLTLAGSTVTTATTDERIQAKAGNYSYRVQGSAGAETLKVYWEKASPSAPFKIVKIEGRAGETIRP